MNKNIGKKFLSIVCVGFVVISISLFNLGKNKAEVEDLFGSRSELGDVNILLQSNKGLYETDEIKVDKDNITIDSMAKQAIYNSNLSKKNIEGRRVLEAVSQGFVDYTDALLDDEDKLASVSVCSEYTLDDSYQTYANIEIKYNDSNKVESYKIPISNQSVDGFGLVYSSVPISIDKNNMYIVTLGSYYSNDYLEEVENKDNDEYADDVFDKTVLDLYKVNLSSKSSKHILSKEYEASDIYVRSDVCFGNNNKSYFLINEKDKDGSYKSSLFEFDVLTKEINTIDLGIKKDKINKFSVDDNKLLLMSFGGIETKDENLQEENSTIRAISVNLENSKVEYLKTINIVDDYDNILQIRKLDNKIYVVAIEYGEDKEYKGNYSYTFTVLDEDKNELLYKGQVQQKMSYFTQVGIVKEDEL